MTIAIAVSSVLLIVLLASLVVVWRRADTATRLLRSLEAEVPDASGAGSLPSRVRGLVNDAKDERVAASTFRAALDGAHSGIAIASSSGDAWYANPSAAGLLHGEGQRAVLMARVKALVTRAVRTGGVERMEVDLHEPERRVLALTAIPEAVEGRDDRVIVVYLDDLSERMRVDAMRTDFVANASHELKTPLGALALLAETLVEVRDDEQRARLASRLVSEAERAARVVDDVLRLAETESLGTDHGPVHLAEVVGGAVAAVEGFATSRGVELIDDGVVDAVVSGDRDQLTSAVRNLLDNAITYTAAKGEGGTVRYRTTVEEGQAAIEVQDTGIGIPVRYRDRIFERFFRVDRARSRESGGTGLGLSIVRNVARVHGGSVAMTSEVGEGSTFVIRLPIADGRQREVSA